ncbi:MAG: hypothetical protein SGPRY_005872, partial [Prymnesium sp.]
FMNNAAGVIVMGVGGRMLYCGPRLLPDGKCALEAHFSGGGLSLSLLSHNPAEAILEAMMDEAWACRLEDMAAELQASAAQVDPSAWLTLPAGRMWPSIVVEMQNRLIVQMPDDAHPRRQATLGCRHPLLLVVNLLCTLIVALIIGCLFYQSGFHYTLPKGSEPSRELPIDFNTGVLMRIGMIFFLGLYFTLTSLVITLPSLQERLLYFHECASGCYGPLCYVLARTVFDVALMRVLPTVLCAAILYPMVGLSSVGESAPTHSLLFTAGLCLCNLVSSTVVNTFGVGCSSVGVATLLSVFFALFSMLFCGLLVNLPAIQLRGAGWLHYGSSLYYLNELLLSDELIGREVQIKNTIQDVKIRGEEVLAQLGFSLLCSRVGGKDDTACWYTVYIPLAVVCICIFATVVLLRFCVKDPH